MNKELLYRYQNGTTTVCLYKDGTKERIWEGELRVDHPESLDVKITNYCDAGCAFCHEQSTTLGKHGDLERLAEVLGVLPPGVEIAIGGGNPLSHPALKDFLIKLKALGLVVNITINQVHLDSFKNLILDLIAEDLVKGVGISYTSKTYFPAIIPILEASDNVVFHLISGINSVDDIVELQTLCLTYHRLCKILILGYKEFGFGLNYYLQSKRIEKNKYQWYIHLPKHFKSDNLILSFDNLAINQLNLKRFFTDKSWNKFFMGDDFVFTMYIDGVKQVFAPSSTSSNKRVNFNQTSLLDYFKNKGKVFEESNQNQLDEHSD